MSMLWKGMSAVKYNTGNIINVRQVYPTIGLPIPKFKIMETGDEFLNCQSQERSQNMLKLVSLPSLNHVEGFQKIGKISTFMNFGTGNSTGPSCSKSG